MLAPQVNLTGSVNGLSGGFRGVAQTISLMRQMVNASKVNLTIRQAATTTIFLAPERDELGEAAKLYELVRDTVRYVKDVHDVETLSTPEKTLLGRIGDCDDQAALLAALFESVGYPTRFVVAAYRDPSVLEHVYLQVLVNGMWVDCDPTEQGMYFGWAPPDPVNLYFERV